MNDTTPSASRSNQGMGSTSSHARKAMKNAAVAVRCTRGSAEALAHDPEDDIVPVEPLGDPARGACEREGGLLMT